ncbi:MAG TPA: VWA domain-containing protein [Candidatus Solibacter sp.]|nr:VWA domain-containing protein [Candidatus Solibacter sp.]
MPQFDAPWLLAALLGLPFIARRRATPALPLNHIAGAPESRRQRFLYLPRMLRLCAFALLIVALSGPRLSGHRTREITRTTGLQLVVDCSGSMLAKDMVFRGKPAARIDVVRELSHDFIFGGGNGLKGRPLDMIGVIAFAEEPVTLCPLTLAHEILRPVVNAIRVGDRADGTAIGDAVAVAAARFHRAETTAGQRFKSTAIILLTDGDNNMGSHNVAQAADIAAQWGVHVYTIAIRPGAPQQAKNVEPGLIELNRLAEETRGKAHLAGDGEALRAIYEEIDHLERSDVETAKLTGGREIMYALAMLAMLVLIGEAVLNETWLRRLPR